MTNNFSPTSSEVVRVEPLPAFIVTALCWLFAILFGVWALPHTVFIRHSCMILGAILGLYVIAYLWKNDLLKIQVNAIPIFLILALFIWVFIHLLWIGKEPQIQLMEFKRIWKKIILCLPFALGLGLGIRYMVEFGDEKKTKKLWRILWLAFALPVLIFYIKFGLTELAQLMNFELSPYLILSEYRYDHSGMPKYFYVFFCLPLFAIAIGAITHDIQKDAFSLKAHALNFMAILFVPIIFYLQSDRNGMLYSVLLMLISLGVLVSSKLTCGTIRQKVFLCCLAILIVVATIISFRVSPAWKMMGADLKVAMELDKIDNWKYQGQSGFPYPTNEYGIRVNPSNYDRATWGLVGMRLAKENLLGYGLMTLSFDHLTKAKWPNSLMSQTHSGWLDFMLGYGAPGLILIMLALLLVWHGSKYINEPWKYIGRWGLGTTGLTMITTEISSEIFINGLVFLILLAAGLAVSFNPPPYPKLSALFNRRSS